MKKIILIAICGTCVLNAATITYTLQLTNATAGIGSWTPVVIKGNPTNVTVTLTAALTAGGGIATNKFGWHATNGYALATSLSTYHAYMPGFGYISSVSSHTNSPTLVTNQTWSYTFAPVSIPEAPPGYLGFYFKVVSGEATVLRVHNTKMTIVSVQAD